MSKQSLLVLWGLTVFVGYMLTGLLGQGGGPGVDDVLWAWTILMVAPVALTVWLGGGAGKLAWIWAGLTVILMLENWLVFGFGSETVKHWSFHPLWFLFGAVGFGYTAAVVEGGARKVLYGVWAALNAIGLVTLLTPVAEAFEPYAFFALMLIQGVPMLIDAPMREGTESAS